MMLFFFESTMSLLRLQTFLTDEWRK